jgi:cbb3-type cytochrome oxidase subunit 3
MQLAILLLASTLVFLAVVVVNTGQELAVRLGGLQGPNLIRGPSVAVVQSTSALSTASDPQAIMTAYHGLYSQLLWIIIGLLILVVVAILSRSTKRATPNERNAPL